MNKVNIIFIKTLKLSALKDLLNETQIKHTEMIRKCSPPCYLTEMCDRHGWTINYKVVNFKFIAEVKEDGITLITGTSQYR